MDGLKSILTSGKTKRRAGKHTATKAAWWTRPLSHLLSLLPLIIAITLPLCLFALFRHRYYRQNPAFDVTPEQIAIRGNTMLSRELILQYLGVTGPRNGFDLVQAEIIDRLRHDTPIIKSIQATFTPGLGLEIYIRERMPLARLAHTARPPLVIDDEGVVFMYPRPTGSYPQIGGFDLPGLNEPGSRLPPQLRCMIHLLTAAAMPEYQLPSSIRNIMLLSGDVDDGLVVTLADGRRITISWPGMSTEKELNDGMLKRLRNLGKTLRAPVSANMKHFNAMAPDRVTASE